MSPVARTFIWTLQFQLKAVAATLAVFAVKIARYRIPVGGLGTAAIERYPNIGLVLDQFEPLPPRLNSYVLPATNGRGFRLPTPAAIILVGMGVFIGIVTVCSPVCTNNDRVTIFVDESYVISRVDGI
jgi:hypothetical protein